MPTHIWIDEKGLFNQKTIGFNTSARNIQAHLDGKDVKLSLKEDKMDFDFSVPTWLEGNGRQLQHLKYYSFIMERVTDAYKGGFRWERDPVTHRPYRIEILNQPILEMYKYAFNGDTSETFSPDNRLVMEVKNPGQYLIPDEPDLVDSWSTENAYVYDIKVPLERAPHIFDMMKQDLDRFFSLHGRIEKRKIKCLVLKRISNLDLLHTKGGRGSFRRADPLGTDLSIHNMPLETSIFHSLVWTNGKNPLPIINDTHYTANIDMEIHSEFSDIPSIRKELQAYGLDLVEEYRVIDMLVIRDDVKAIDKNRLTKIK